MAEKKLSVTIALKGGKEIENQLQDISEAGKKAFADIGKAADETGRGFKEIKPDEVIDKLKQLGVTGVDEINKIQAAVKQAGRLETLVQGVTSVETAFAALEKVAVPVIGGIALAFKEAVQASLAWSESINKLSAEAMKLGSTVEQVDKLRAAFERAGIGSEAISQGLQKIHQAADKNRIEAVTTAFEQLQAAINRGYGPRGTEQLKLLVEEAQKVGPAADKAREALQKLGITIESPVQSLAKLQQQLGETKGTEAFIRQLEAMKDTTQRNALALDQLGEKFGTDLVQGLNTGSLSAEKFAQNMQAAAQVTQEQALEAAKTQQTLNQLSTEWERFKARLVEPIAMPLLEFLRSELPAIQSGISNTVRELTMLKDAIVGMTSDPIANTVREFTNLGAAIVGAAGAVGNFISSMGNITWDAISSAGVAAWNAITNAIQSAIDAVLRFIGLKPSESGGTSGVPPDTSGGQRFARGGLLGGIGSGTSDSNLAWVSRGEHIMPARAVAQPGVLAFLEALRRSGGNLRHVLDGISRYAAGGLVRMPQVGGGGHVGMSHVTIQFPGLAPISGLRASAAVVDELRTAAALAQVRSGGRKPSRYT